MKPRIPVITKKRRKKKILLLILLTAVLLVALSLALALTVFRPQAAALYQEIRNFFLVRPDSAYRQYEDTDGKMVIWLDAGHGGTDPGAVSPFLQGETEASINYRLTRLVKRELEALGYIVRLGWDDDSPTENGQYPLAYRLDRINADPDADFVIWIHCNSFTDPSVSGGRIYYLPETSRYTHYLCEAVADGIEKAHAGERPRLYPLTQETAYKMLKGVSVPSFLIETLFVSHEGDAAKLLDPVWLETEAKGLADGIRAFVEGTS